MLQALPPPEQPPEIVVTGTALPAPVAEQVLHVERLGPVELRAAGPQPLERLIERFAGVQQFRRSDSRSAHPTSQGVTLRALGGNAASRAMVVLDGVPQSDPFGGWVAWPAFSTLALSEVRLVRGGGSVTAGPGALAGTLELSSRANRGADAAVQLGGRHSVEGEAFISGSVGSGLLSLSLDGSHGDGFVPVTKVSRGDADRAAPYRALAGRLRWVAPVGSDAEIQAALSLFGDRRERGLAYTGNRSTGTDLSVRAVSHGALPWTALVYAQSRQFESSFASTDAGRRTARRVSLQYDVPGSAIGWSAEARPRLDARVDLRIGADGRRLSGRSREYANYAGGQPTRQREAGGQSSHSGAFAEVTGRSGAATLTGAARVDHWRIFDGSLAEQNLASGVLLTDQAYPTRSGWEPTARLGALLDAGKGVSLRAAAYAGWRLPTLNELFRPFRAGSDATAANPLLKPERLRGAEAGFDWAEGDWNASASLFANRLHDAVANVTLASGPGVFPGVGFVGAGGAYRQRQNLPAIRSRGLEAAGGWKHGPWSASASVSLTDARVQGSGPSSALDSLRPAQTPRLAGSMRAGWSRDRRSAGLVLRYEGRRFEDDLNRQRLPGAVTLDLAGELPVTRRLSLTARAENLLDKEVIAAVSGEGVRERSAPRTVWIGLRYSRVPVR